MNLASRVTGRPDTFTVRPEKISVVAAGSPAVPGTHAIEGIVIESVYVGAFNRLRVAVGDEELLVISQNLDVRGIPRAVEGQRVTLRWDRGFVEASGRDGRERLRRSPVPVNNEGERYMRFKVVWFSLMALLAAACGGSATDDEGATLPTEIGESEGQVNIVAWAGYIERWRTDPAYDWVTQFEADSGCQVNVKTAGTSDEMVALMTGSDEYDLVTASGDASNRLIAGGTVQEINIDLIEGWDTVDPRLQDAPWHTVDGKHYGVPYDWGANVLAYNTEVFGDTPPTSWNVVFEEQTLPDGESNAGRVQAYDGPIYIADAALFLGFEQPYALTAGSVRRRHWISCASSGHWLAATGTTPSSRSMTSPTRGWRLLRAGRSR